MAYSGLSPQLTMMNGINIVNKMVRELERIYTSHLVLRLLTDKATCYVSPPTSDDTAIKTPASIINWCKRLAVYFGKLLGPGSIDKIHYSDLRECFENTPLADF
jgi:hypothetical protein